MVGIEIFRALDHWMYYQVLMIGSWGLCPGPLIGGEEAAETRARPMARRPAEVSEVDDGEQWPGGPSLPESAGEVTHGHHAPSGHEHETRGHSGRANIVQSR